MDTHYFGFRTAYGDWTYWGFGAVLCLIGTFSIVLAIPPSDLVPFIVAVVEIMFGIWLILADQWQQPLKTKFNELQSGQNLVYFLTH